MMKSAVFAKNIINHETKLICSPVLKWAGGKTQLLPELAKHYPFELVKGEIDTYIEPFIGGGAVFFDIVSKYKIKQAFLFDVNPELVILYNTLKYEPDQVINELSSLSGKYLSISDENQRKEIYYKTREIYNADVNKEHKACKHSVFNARRAALTLFLNRTCYNGLFRVNSKGEFNVPFGQYKNPTILFSEKLKAVSNALQIAQIKLADFAECENYINGSSFIYYDPPYRPIRKTSSFTAYSKDSFDDGEQIRLANMIKKLDKKGVLQLLSNSDPTNYIEDNFFDELYKDFEIIRINASRRINANASKRGLLRELLIKNYMRSDK